MIVLQTETLLLSTAARIARISCFFSNPKQTPNSISCTSTSTHFQKLKLENPLLSSSTKSFVCELVGELGYWVTGWGGHKVCGQFEELKKSPILTRVTQSGDASSQHPASQTFHFAISVYRDDDDAFMKSPNASHLCQGYMRSFTWKNPAIWSHNFHRAPCFELTHTKRPDMWGCQ